MTSPGCLSFMVVGAIAGIVTVYSTMPLDVVKTRMQSLEGSKMYKHAIHCLVTVVQKEGLTALWKGATPRLGRLIVMSIVNVMILHGLSIHDMI